MQFVCNYLLYFGQSDEFSFSKSFWGYFFFSCMTNFWFFLRILLIMSLKQAQFGQNPMILLNFSTIILKIIKSFSLVVLVFALDASGRVLKSAWSSRSHHVKYLAQFL